MPQIGTKFENPGMKNKNFLYFVFFLKFLDLLKVIKRIQSHEFYMKVKKRKFFNFQATVLKFGDLFEGLKLASNVKF